MSDLHEQIADLETEVDDLADTAQRVRKTIAVSKGAVAFGAVLLVSLGLGVIRFEPLALVAGISAMIGGVAFYGSNRSTLDEIVSRMASLQARRNELIDALQLDAFGSEPSDCLRLG